MSLAADQRKRPCAGIHRSDIASSTFFWCNGCGSWEIRDGRAVRP